MQSWIVEINSDVYHLFRKSIFDVLGRALTQHQHLRKGERVYSINMRRMEDDAHKFIRESWRGEHDYNESENNSPSTVRNL